MIICSCAEALAQSLAALGLAPQALLFVQPDED